MQTPSHVGIILDGNRRWAKQHRLKSMEGHQKGAEVFRDLSLKTFEKGVNYLTAYIFSKENWKRKREEVGFLMRLLIKAVELHLDDYHRRKIKIVFSGEREGLDKSVLKTIEKTEAKTKDNTGGTLVLCFNYSGTQELADAYKRMLLDHIEDSEVCPETIDKYIDNPEVPPLDLVIRTSGEKRLSGFELWRAAYAELYFTDTLWPDFTEADLDAALTSYSQRDRRFGI